MKKTYTDFADYLKSVHAEDYTGTDDDMWENFEDWVDKLDLKLYIAYADMYAIIKSREEIEDLKLKNTL